MKLMTALAVTAVLAASPALAQERRPQTTQPPGGTYESYPQSQPGGQQQAGLSDERPVNKPHPGTLRKFNNNRGGGPGSSGNGGPEVEFDVQAQKEAEQRAKMYR